MRSRDEFADDCLHRQLVPRFYIEIQLSGILAKCLQVSLAGAADPGERVSENGPEASSGKRRQGRGTELRSARRPDQRAMRVAGQ